MDSIEKVIYELINSKQKELIMAIITSLAKRGIPLDCIENILAPYLGDEDVALLILGKSFTDAYLINSQLWEDPQFVCRAVTAFPHARTFAPERVDYSGYGRNLDIPVNLRRDPEFMIKLIKEFPRDLGKAECVLPVEVVCDAINKMECEDAKYWALQEYGINKRVMGIDLVKYDGMMLAYIPKELHTPEIVGAAVLQNRCALEFA